MWISSQGTVNDRKKKKKLPKKCHLEYKRVSDTECSHMPPFKAELNIRDFSFQ